MDNLFNYTITEVTKILNLAAKKQGLKEAKTSNVNRVFGARVRKDSKEAAIDIVPTDISILIHLSSGPHSFKEDYIAEPRTISEVDKELPKINEFITECFALKLVKKN